MEIQAPLVILTLQANELERLVREWMCESLVTPAIWAYSAFARGEGVERVK
jgi:hypothetical protein